MVEVDVACVVSGAALVARRNIVNYIGVTVSDNPGADRVDVDVAGAATLAGGWQDDGSVVRLVTPEDAVVIGGAVDGLRTWTWTDSDKSLKVPDYNGFVNPGIIRFREGLNFADLVYHPANIIESSGGLFVRMGNLGFRAAGPDATNALILFADATAAYFAAETGTIDGDRDIRFNTRGVTKWRIKGRTTNGHFIAESDRIYDIGGDTDNRPRNVNAQSFRALATAGLGFLFSGENTGLSHEAANFIKTLVNNSVAMGVRHEAGVVKLGFFPTVGAAPVAQQAHIADPAGGGTVDAEARTAINSILNLIEAYGLMAP